MSQRYKQPSIAGATRFSKSPMAEVEFSRMTATPRRFTTFNAGDIVPIACWEVLPHSTFDVDMDFVTRLSSAVIKPTMGDMQIDIYAFFVQNRVVNESWKNVQGENTSGIWSAPEVDLAPLVVLNSADVKVDPGSVADYYGFPTQAPIKAQYLQQMNDLKFRGYVEIFNDFFRDQNYQPPIPYSKLNIYNGFMLPKGTAININSQSVNVADTVEINIDALSDGKFSGGAVTKAIYGDGYTTRLKPNIISAHLTAFSALDKPLKANKLHDPFTSVLPSPQKGAEVYFGIGNTAPVTGVLNTTDNPVPFASDISLKLLANYEQSVGAQVNGLYTSQLGTTAVLQGNRDNSPALSAPVEYKGTNMVVTGLADLSTATGISVNDLRIAVATQQVYECLSRSGSRYLSTLRAFFNLDVESPFADQPVELGHIRRELDLYQVAQTSASEEGNTAQGNLTAFGYTTSNGKLFTRTFLEHGYIHVLAVVRHRNVYSTMLHPDNFRKSTLDFYLPQFANIGEQPIRLATLNPFIADEDNKVLGYQEAWWEYRYMPDEVCGAFRTGLENGLDIWTYADPYDAGFTVVNGEWLKSNSQEVLDRTLSVSSALMDQFLGMFAFKVDKQLPMPTYSVPGLDTI